MAASPAKALHLILKALILRNGGDNVHVDADKKLPEASVYSKGLKTVSVAMTHFFAGGLGRGSLGGGGVSGVQPPWRTRSGSSAAAGSETGP